MGYGLFDGCECCVERPEVDWVSYDDNDSLFNRVRAREGTTPLLIWDDSSTFDELGGIARAPGFALGGLIWDGGSGASGIYHFDPSDGTVGSFFAGSAPANAEESAMYNEAGGRVCFHNGSSTFLPLLTAINSAGSTATYTQSGFGLYLHTNGCVRRLSDAAIWRTVQGSMNVLDHQSTTRVDLSSVASTSTSIGGITSGNDGETMWVLGIGEDSGTRYAELFRITASSGSASIVASHSVREAEGSVGPALTFVDGWLFWAIDGDRRVWSYGVSSGVSEVVTDAAWSGFGVSPAAGGWNAGFFAPQ